MNTRTTRRRAAALVGAAAAVLVLATGCGGGGEGGGYGTGPAAPPATNQVAGISVPVTLKEWSITVPKKLAPGTYTFAVQNAGSAPHALAVMGPGLDTKETPTINGGQRTQLTVTLAKPGVYEFWCPVANHIDLGMKVMVTVT